MKFIVSSSTLLKKLQILGGVINTSNTIPVLDHFLFELDNSNLKITSSDLETTMISSIEVDSSSKGSVAIPSKLLIDTLKTFPEQPLTFSIEDNNTVQIMENMPLHIQKVINFPKQYLWTTHQVQRFQAWC